MNLSATSRSLSLLLSLAVTPAAVIPDSIPITSLAADLQEPVKRVFEKTTFVLKTDFKTVDGDPAIFEYLLDHLEICALAGRALGIASYKTRREPDGRLYGDDGQGASGHMTVLAEPKGRRVFYLDGTHKAMFKVRGKSVAVFDFGPKGDAGSEYRLSVWVRVENGFFAFVTKIFVARARMIAEEQFAKMLNVPIQVAIRSRKDSAQVIDAFSELPESDRNQLSGLTALVRKTKKTQKSPT